MVLRSSRLLMAVIGFILLFSFALPAKAVVVSDAFLSVSASYSHSVAVRADGTVWTWGDNAFGQLGYETYGAQQVYPRKVPGIAHAVSAAAGGNPNDGGGSAFTVVLVKENGVSRLYSFGSNADHQLGDGTTSGGSTPREVRLSAGAVWSDTNAQAVAAGYDVAGVVMSDGRVMTWGDATAPQLGHAASSYPDYVLGESGSGQLGNIRQLSFGQSHALALNTSGTVQAWGNNNSGQLGDGTTTARAYPAPVRYADGSPLTGVQQIAAGNKHSVALTGGIGYVYGWGSNTYNQLSQNPSNRSDQLHPVTLKQYGYDYQSQSYEYIAVTDASLVGAGGEHTLVSLLDGDWREVYAAGRNNKGQLGAHWEVLTSELRQVNVGGYGEGSDPPTPRGLYGGYQTSFALMNDGHLYGFGENEMGQLGTGGGYGEAQFVPYRLMFTPVAYFYSNYGQFGFMDETNGSEVALSVPQDITEVTISAVTTSPDYGLHNVSASGGAQTQVVDSRSVKVTNLAIGSTLLSLDVQDGVDSAHYTVRIVRAGDTMANLKVGDRILFANRTWFVVNPALGKIATEFPDDYTSKVWSDNASASTSLSGIRFNPNDEQSLAYYLNHTYYDKLTPFHGWMKDENFTAALYNNEMLPAIDSPPPVQARVGLMTKAEFEALYAAGVTEGYYLEGWLLHPVDNGNGTYSAMFGTYSGSVEGLDPGSQYQSYHPVVSLVSGVTVSGGTGTTYDPYVIGNSGGSASSVTNAAVVNSNPWTGQYADLSIRFTPTQALGEGDSIFVSAFPYGFQLEAYAYSSTYYTLAGESGQNHKLENFLKSGHSIVYELDQQQTIQAGQEVTIHFGYDPESFNNPWEAGTYTFGVSTSKDTKPAYVTLVLNDDKALGLSASTGTVTFDGEGQYTVNVPQTTTQLTLTASPPLSSYVHSVSLLGGDASVQWSSGNSAQVTLTGSAYVQFVVKAQNNTMKSYVVHIEKETGSLSSAKELALTSSIGTVQYDNAGAFTVTVPAATPDNTSLSLSATMSPHASMTSVTGNTYTSFSGSTISTRIVGGVNMLAVTVQAQDLSTKTYIVNIIRQPAADLTISLAVYGTHTPVPLTGSTFHYTAGSSDTTVKFQVYGNPSITSLTVSGATYNIVDGVLTFPTLNFGDNSATIQVEGPSGQYIYTLIVSREAALSSPIVVPTDGKIAFSGGVSLTFPAGMLPAGTQLTATPSTVNPPGGTTAAGPILNFTFDRVVQLTAPVQLTLPVTGSVTSPKKAGIFYYNETSSAWEYVPSQVVGGNVTGAVTHFSTYGVLSADTASAPVITKQAVTGTAMTEITLVSATSGASIYYTLDGTDPTANSALYNALSKPKITAGQKVKAIAVKNGMVTSGISELILPDKVDIGAMLVQIKNKVNVIGAPDFTREDVVELLKRIEPRVVLPL